MGNSLGSSKRFEPSAIETIFKMPSPIPSWSSGGGFAKGTIDFGDIEVCQISTFTKIWATSRGGEDDLGATFFAPSLLPDGFFALGSYAQPNNKPLFGWLLAAEDTSTNRDCLAEPVDYSLVWSSESSNVKRDGNGYFWLPVAPEGFKSVGHIVTATPNKPSLHDVRCVRSDFADDCENESQIWSSGQDGIGVYSLRPSVRGTQARGVCVGTFVAQLKSSSTSSGLSCLKNKNFSFSAMPNLEQIKALVLAYSPWIYFHPDESYFPSSTRWFFDNGGLLYPNATRIDSTGSNLPQSGSNDGEYWLDLPADGDARNKVARGDLPSAESYVHVKPMLGATFVDAAFWMFYPFNGPSKARLKWVDIKLGRIGEHVGDWEHVTLRVSNFTGELRRVYFSQHAAGTWVDASLVEYRGGNKPVAYASLHGHALYPKPGLVIQGNRKLGIGIRNDTAKGEGFDAGAKFTVVSADYLQSGPAAVTEPAWLNYMREWGPKIRYDIGKEISSAVRFLPKKLRTALENVLEGLPAEVLGEEGPTGPKGKDNWNMDETLED